MSNHLAVAVVTAALKQMVQDALDEDVPGAKARVGRPDAADADAQPTVNLFLYHVMANPRARNNHLPSRKPDGDRRGPSVVAIDLYYLVSFYGPPSEYAPERLLATVARALEHRPIITRSIIEKAIEEAGGMLDDADLHRAPESVRLTPTGLSLDELSKLWSVLLQVPYVLSLAYKCESLLIETKEAGSASLPVTSVGIGTLLIGGPTIEAIEPATGPGSPILWGNGLVLRGRGLDRSDMMLRVDDHSVDLTVAKVAPSRLEFPLTSAVLGGAELAAGAVPVEIVLPPPPGAPANLSRVSDRAVFTLRPRLGLPANAVVAAGPPGQPADGTVRVTFSPRVTKGQQVRLLLDEQTAARPQSWQLAPDPVADAAYPVAELTFPFQNVKRATYHLQARVDGVASAPEIDLAPASPTFRQITGPRITIP